MAGVFDSLGVAKVKESLESGYGIIAATQPTALHLKAKHSHRFGFNEIQKRMS